MSATLAPKMSNEPKQTTPKGAEIPVPSRADWEKTLRKLAKPEKPKDSPSDGPEK